MFSKVFVNSVFFALFVLICYYMLVNVLSERKENHFALSDLKKNSSELEVDFDQAKKDLSYAVPERVPESHYRTQDKTRDIYDHVFKDSNADNELDSFFDTDGDLRKKSEADPEMRCETQCGNRLRTDYKCNAKNIDFCNTTVPTQQEIRGHYSGFDRPECLPHLNQDKHFYLVNNYKDEKLINGGRMNNSLDGKSRVDSGGVLAFDGAEPSGFSSF